MKPTKAEIAEALEGSIRKWERIVASTEGEDDAGENCPLCMLQEDCEGCPVQIDVGEANEDGEGCDATPYYDWMEHHNLRHYIGYPRHRQEGCDECLRLARAELAFLEGLRT